MRTGDIPRQGEVYVAFKEWSRKPEAGDTEALLKDVRAFFITELGCSIVAWFVAVGALEAHEAEAVRAEVFHQAQHSLR